MLTQTFISGYRTRHAVACRCPKWSKNESQCCAAFSTTSNGIAKPLRSANGGSPLESGKRQTQLAVFTVHINHDWVCKEHEHGNPSAVMWCDSRDDHAARRSNRAGTNLSACAI